MGAVELVMGSLRSKGLMREIGVSRFLDMVMERVYRQDHDYLVHSFSNRLGAKARPGRGLGLLVEYSPH